MYQLLQILAVVLVAIGMALSLAHALECPGKRRLDRDTYVAVQAIYYPGFTVGGLFGEFGAMIATAALLAATPLATMDFWLVLATLLTLLLAHGLYWLVVHPVNKVWLQDQPLHAVGAAFFAAGGGRTTTTDWTALRDRWEYGHVARAVVVAAGFVAMVVSIAM